MIRTAWIAQGLSYFVACGVNFINQIYYPNCQVSEYVKERITALREQNPGQVCIGFLERIVLLRGLFILRTRNILFYNFLVVIACPDSSFLIDNIAVCSCKDLCHLFRIRNFDIFLLCS